MQNRKSLLIKSSVVLFIAVSAIVLLSVFHVCNPTNSNISPLRVYNPETHAPETARRVEVTFTFERSMWDIENQFAIWVSDEGFGYVQTLFVSNQVERRLRTTPNFLGRWQQFGGNPSAMDSSQLQAISGRAPRSGNYYLYWDFTNHDGTPVADDTFFRINIEIMSSAHSHVFFRSGNIGAHSSVI